MKKFFLLLPFFLLTGCGGKNPESTAEALIDLLFTTPEGEPRYSKEFGQAFDSFANAPDSDAQQIHAYQGQAYRIAYGTYSAKYQGEKQDFHLVKVWPQHQDGFVYDESDLRGYTQSEQWVEDIAKDFMRRNHCQYTHPYQVKEEVMYVDKQDGKRFNRYVFAFTCKVKAQPYETQEFYNAIEALANSQHSPGGQQPELYTHKSIFGYSYDYRLIHQSYNQAGYQLYLVKIWPRDHEGFDKLVPYDFKAHPDYAAGAFVAKNDCKDDSPLYPVHEYVVYLQDNGRIKSTQYVFAFKCE